MNTSIVASRSVICYESQLKTVTFNIPKMKTLILSIIIVATIGCNLITQSESKHTTITAPESKASNFETTDSSFFKMKLKDDKYEIEFLKNVSVINNLDELDSFFFKNQNLINKEKIVITNYDTTDSKLRSLLLKYGLVSFAYNVE